ncbi:MAG: methionyl-tRNA formyltransferase [Pseudomonadota bacterium]
MSSTEYIFASCKQWHRPYFEALERDIPARWLWVSQPDELLAALEQANPRYIFFLHWNWLVPQTVWRRYECVCFHMTDVPYGRGGSPLQNLIVAGHSSTKLTALRMVEEMDAGPVYAKRHLTLTGSAQDIYLQAGALSNDIIRWMVEVQPEPVPQNGEVVLFRRRVPEQSRIPKSAELDQLYDLIRMLDADGYPHAFLDYGDFRLKFRKAHREDEKLTAQVTIQIMHIEADK